MPTRQSLSAQIRKSLNNAFDDPQFSAFCFDYFEIIYDKFSRGLRKDEKMTLLLDHCRRTDFQKLLEAVRGEYEQSDFPRDELKPLIEALEAYLKPITSELTKHIILSLYQQPLGEKMLLSQLLKKINFSLSDVMFNIFTQQESKKYIEFEVRSTAIFCWLTDEGRQRGQDFLRKNEITNTTLDNQDSVPYNLNEPQTQNLEFSWSLEGLDKRCARIVQRQDLIEDILKILVRPSHKKTAFLYGAPRVGKTFLLTCLQEKLQDQYVAVKINLSGWASIEKLSTFLHEIANQIKIILELSLSGSQIAPFKAVAESEATMEFTKFMNQLVYHVHARGRGLLLMFDELEYLVRQETDQQIFEYLSGCIETYSDRQVKFIFACSGHMVDLVKYGSLAKLWAKGKGIEISCFDQKISRDLIRALTKPYFSLDAKALDLIVQLGNGQPAILRHTLPFVVESWKNKEGSNKISENDLIDILDNICIELISELQYIWSRLEPLEQQILLHMAQYDNRDKWHEGFKEDEIMEMGNKALMRKSLKRLVRVQILHYSENSEDKLYMVRLGVILESLSSDMLSVSESGA